VSTILPFPRRNRGSTVRVEHIEGEWTVIYGDQGYPYETRAAALRDALAIADQALRRSLCGRTGSARHASRQRKNPYRA
jgi:hypothetical protein